MKRPTPVCPFCSSDLEPELMDFYCRICRGVVRWEEAVIIYESDYADD